MSEVSPKSLGRYSVHALLGRGATSVVYRAVERESGQVVAIKLLRSELLADRQRGACLERFRREIEIGRQLCHPNIVKVLDDGSTGGRPYLVMELVKGRELTAFTDLVPPLPVNLILQIGLEILDALGHAHDRGVIHRDVKPGNILFCADGTLKLMDFGIASLRSSDLTHTGDLLGTPSYMAPEQLLGQPVDGRTDLFSVAIILYYLLAGERPFRGSVGELMHQIVAFDPPPPSVVDDRVPTALDAILLRALAKNRADRFASARDFAEALLTVKHRLPPAVATPWPPPPASPHPAPTFPTLSGRADLEDEFAYLGEQLTARLDQARSEPVTALLVNHIERLLDRWFDVRVLFQAEQLTWTDVAPADPGADFPALCLESGLRPLAARIAAAAPTPDRPVSQLRRDWSLLVRLFNRLREALVRVGETAAAEAVVDRLAGDIVLGVRRYATRLGRVALAGDNFDLSQLATDFLRLDALQVALEDLGCRHQARHLHETVLMLTEIVVAKITAMIRDALAVDDPVGRFGIAAMLTEAEELAVLISRLIEAGVADGSGDDRAAGANDDSADDLIAGLAGAAVTPEILAELFDAAAALACLLVEELRAAVAAGGVEARVLSARLAQLGVLHRLAGWLPGAAGLPQLQALIATVHDGVEALAGDLVALPQRDAGAEALLGAVFELAEQSGWHAISAKTVVGLRPTLGAPAGLCAGQSRV
ncbi:MAG: protein kinase [Azospirillum sp.]|nr:protein kinase [Azospirillum sp.]